MHTNPARHLHVKTIHQVPNRAMPRLQDGVFPLAGRRSDRFLADGDKRPAFAFQPVGIGGGGEKKDGGVVHSDCLPVS